MNRLTQKAKPLFKYHIEKNIQARNSPTNQFFLKAHRWRFQRFDRRHISLEHDWHKLVGYTLLGILAFGNDSPPFGWLTLIRVCGFSYDSTKGALRMNDE